MSKYVVDSTELTGIADAIRAKTGGSDPIAFPTGFTTEIGSLATAKVVTGVTFGATISSSASSLVFRVPWSSSSTRYATAISEPTGKMWIIKSVSSLSVFGLSQTLSSYIFKQESLPESSTITIYSATGQDITVNKPSSGAELTIVITADVYEIDEI